MTFTCYYCKGRVIAQRIRHIHPWHDQVFIFDNVPAEVCQQCGEIYFAPDTIEMFDQIVRGGTTKPAAVVSVPVFSLADLAAA